MDIFGSQEVVQEQIRLAIQESVAGPTVSWIVAHAKVAVACMFVFFIITIEIHRSR